MTTLKIGALVLIFALGSGCAAMNTFQTPEVLDPGQVMLSPGLVVGTHGPTEDTALPDGGQIPLGRGLQIQGRVGVLPHLEVGAQVIGLGAVGFDAKVGFQGGPFLFAANAGLGFGGEDAGGLNGFESSTTHTRFGGVFMGYGGGYMGAKVIDYRHRRDVPEAPVQHYDRVIPGLALGYAGSRRGKARPVLEVNAYRFPGEVVVTLGVGVQIFLGEATGKPLARPRNTNPNRL